MHPAVWGGTEIASGAPPALLSLLASSSLNAPTREMSTGDRQLFSSAMVETTSSNVSPIPTMIDDFVVSPAAVARPSTARLRA